MTSEPIGGFSFPLDKTLEQIRAVPERDDDKTEWIKAHLRLRLWMSYLTLYSDLARHGGVELDPKTGLATVVRWKPEDIDEAGRAGDLGQLRDAMAQIHGDAAAAYIPPPKRKRGGVSDPKVDKAEDDYYYIKDLLYRKYLDADEKRLYRWYGDAISIIADFHGVEPDSLNNRIHR